MARAGPKIVSERRLRWLLNLYPPLLFNRVRIVHFSGGFRACRVIVKRSLMTRNLNGTTFGGAIFCGFDPIHPILYWQALARQGYEVQVWLKGAEIQYKKPAATSLVLDFELTDEDLAATCAALDRDNKVVRTHVVEAKDRDGIACAAARCDVHIRRLRTGQKTLSGF